MLLRIRWRRPPTTWRFGDASGELASPSARRNRKPVPHHDVGVYTNASRRVCAPTDIYSALPAHPRVVDPFAGSKGITAKDVGGGTLIAWLRDQDGNVIGLVQEPG